MRLELTFELANASLPKDNKSIWISYLKYAISQCNNEKYFEQYFLGTNIKDYSYSLLLPKPKFTHEKVFLANNTVKMIFSASNRKKTGLIFYAAFIAMKNKCFKLPEGNSIVLKKIIQMKEHQIVSHRILVKTVTGGGLVIRVHDKDSNRDQYFTPENENFTDVAKEILSYEAKLAGFSERIANTIDIIPIDCKKIVDKQYGIFLDLTKGVFILEGDPELLQFYYQAGLGSKHSMGYGLIDVIAQDVE